MSDYINLVLSGLSSSFFYGFIGLVIGLLIIVLVGKKGLLQREEPFFQFVTKFYYFFFPFIFFIFFWLSGSIWYTKSQVIKATDQALNDVKKDFLPRFQTYTIKIAKDYVSSGTVPTNDEIVNYFIETNPEKTTSSYRIALKTTLSSVVEYLLGNEENKGKRLIELSKKASSGLFETGYQTIQDTTHQKINQFSMPFFIPILFLFLGAMLLPSIEIFVANRKTALPE